MMAKAREHYYAEIDIIEHIMKFREVRAKVPDVHPTEAKRLKEARTRVLHSESEGE